MESSAASLESLATKPATNSIARSAVDGGQCTAAVSRRLAKAADRHEGAAAPDVRGEKMIFKARNSNSSVDWDMSTLLSMLGTRLKGRIKA